MLNNTSALLKLILKILSWCCVFSFAFASVSSITEEILDYSTKEVIGEVRYHFDSSVESCSYVILMGVGTFMSVKDYDDISSNIVNGNPIAIFITDHNRDEFQKTSPEKYARLANEVRNRMRDLLHVCDEARFVIGGHSASGQASIEAWQRGLLRLDPVGYVGLDPYEIDEKTIDTNTPLTIPAIFWGFTRTTCLVAKEKAAEKAYAITSSRARVLYTIHNDGACKTTHCVFTDNGCGVKPLVCGAKEKSPWVYQSVAKSVQHFLNAITDGAVFRREDFELHNLPVAVSLYVNMDAPMPPPYFANNSQPSI